MAQLKLQNGHTQDVTVLSNRFIDEFMCEANGEFVKIYVYLLRCLSDVPKEFSISFIADKINLTEKDVLRALKYWEKVQLLTLTTDSENRICGISLEMPGTAPTTPSDFTQQASDFTESKSVKKTATQQAYMETAVTLNTFPPVEDYTPENQSQLEANTALSQVLFITEQYIGRPLNSSEILRIYYFYDILQFPTDLIEYLVEHCVCNGKKSMRYIEKVALAWAEKGIRTVSEAKAESNTFHKDYFTILKSFGIRNRNPVSAEVTYMNKWLNTYLFTTDIIAEACNRTVQQVGNPSFPYADSILTAWHKKGIVIKKDIEALDSDFYKNQAEQQKNKTAKAVPEKNTGKNTNKFNNFDQRSYDYTELEKQLTRM